MRADTDAGLRLVCAGLTAVSLLCSELKMGSTRREEHFPPVNAQHLLTFTSLKSTVSPLPPFAETRSGITISVSPQESRRSQTSPSELRWISASLIFANYFCQTASASAAILQHRDKQDFFYLWRKLRKRLGRAIQKTVFVQLLATS